MMILENPDKLLFYNLLGHGNLQTSRVIFLGNEFGLASTTLEKYLENLRNVVKNNQVNLIGKNWWDGFLFNTNGEAPITSIFVQFISRLMLALRENNEEWFYNLTFSDRVKFNNYILNEFHKTESSTINIRPLPRHTESTWIYDNIDKGEYNKDFNFFLDKHQRNVFSEERLLKIKKVFGQSNKEIIIGVGDKWNKEKFFQYLYPNMKFERLKFEDEDFLINNEKKIIICDYFDNRSGIKLKGLQFLYHIIKSIK
jgi:hypothetical protein